jgi:hypothetical protein
MQHRDGGPQQGGMFLPRRRPDPGFEPGFLLARAGEDVL